MALRDILVCLDATDAGAARLRLAAGLARQHRANLSASFVMPEDIFGASPFGAFRVPGVTAGSDEGRMVAGSPGALLLAEPPRGPTPVEIVEGHFRDAVWPQMIEGGWHQLRASEGAALTELARASDLVIVGQSAGDRRGISHFRPEDLVVACGRPLLVVPYAGHFATVGRRVLIAWDGTREAARAAHDALPLIGDAETVTVVTVQAQEARFGRHWLSLDRIVRHLEHHGLAARGEETVRGGIPIADVLLSRAADLAADLIVAGAYHHSQLREALVGGVSRDLLDHMTVPLLMSH